MSVGQFNDTLDELYLSGALTEKEYVDFPRPSIWKGNPYDIPYNAMDDMRQSMDGAESRDSFEEVRRYQATLDILVRLNGGVRHVDLRA